MYILAPKNPRICALVDVAQWIEHWTVNQKVTGSISGQGTCLGCRPGPQLGECKRQQINVSLTHQCFSPSFSPSLPIFLKINE